jgi:serrate RNA effector molecule
LTYLRVTFNTCYYCAAVCDHVEELHRKCPKHVRKPLPDKVVAPANDEAGEEKEEEESGGKEKPKEKEKDPKDRGDKRWERNGTCQRLCKSFMRR